MLAEQQPARGRCVAKLLPANSLGKLTCTNGGRVNNNTSTLATAYPDVWIATTSVNGGWPVELQALAPGLRKSCIPVVGICSAPCLPSRTVVQAQPAHISFKPASCLQARIVSAFY